jgi:hypothetical protein
VVVLTVDVSGDGTANRDIASARCDRYEEPMGNQRLEESIDADSGFGSDEHGLGVGRGLMHSERIYINGLDDPTTAVLGGVAIAATEAPGQQTAGVALGK